MFPMDSFIFWFLFLCMIIHIVTSPKRRVDFDCRSILKNAKAKQNFRLLAHVGKFEVEKGTMTRRTYNPRTARLAKIAGIENNKIRLTKADREFLTDLAKVQIISATQAADNHYVHLKTQGSRSLQRLVDAGIISSRNIFVSGQGRYKTFEFSSHEMAVAWGGRLPSTGNSKSDYHELITSEAYFRYMGRL